MLCRLLPFHLYSVFIPVFLLAAILQDYPFTITSGISQSCSKTRTNVDWPLIGWLLSGLPTEQETIEGQNNELAAHQ